MNQDSGRTGKLSALRGLPLRTVVFGIAAVLVALAISVGSVEGYRYWQIRRDEQARTEVTQVAARAVEAMFTYNYQNVDASIDAAAKNLRGSVYDEYTQVSKQLIIPGTKEKQLTVVSTVQASGVVSASASHAVVLLFLNQEATPKDAPKGTMTASRLRVSMDKDGGHWVLSEVKPV
ncbi:h domain protein [Nocardia sp. NPDC052566]|uniref:h domain protein n=1 Tax=Nocardia sp. NPDC052566 TaxID=3364330 RepID=UPI0037CB7C1F